jgi:hypothetical protein
MAKSKTSHKKLRFEKSIEKHTSTDSSLAEEDYFEKNDDKKFF